MTAIRTLAGSAVVTFTNSTPGQGSNPCGDCVPVQDEDALRHVGGLDDLGAVEQPGAGDLDRGHLEDRSPERPSEHRQLDGEHQDREQRVVLRTLAGRLGELGRALAAPDRTAQLDLGRHLEATGDHRLIRDGGGHRAHPDAMPCLQLRAAAAAPRGLDHAGSLPERATAASTSP